MIRICSKTWYMFMYVNTVLWLTFQSLKKMTKREVSTKITNSKIMTELYLWVMTRSFTEHHISKALAKLKSSM